MSRAKLKREIESAGCVIVPMSEHDLLEVVEIEETTGLSQWGWEAYRAELEKPEAIMLVARRQSPDPQSEQRISGYIAARLSADELHINNIGVRTVARRRGLGTALLDMALDIGAECGANLAVLEVRAGNHAAQELYARAGFCVVGERRNYYRAPVESAKIMTRPLASKA
jgi:[ribosomal protein S18]-alanine N-acetyltransferase